MSDSPQPDVVPSPGGVAGLLAHHRDRLARRGLSDQTIAAAGFYSITEAEMAVKILGRGEPYSGVPVLAMPVYGVNGTVTGTILRPETLAGAAGQGRCVESSEIVPGIYFPPTLAWDGLRESDAPIFIAVDIEDALLLGQAGLAAIACPDIYGFLDVLHNQQTGAWRLNPGLSVLRLAGREFYLTLSSGCPKVGAVVQAEARVASLLAFEGAKVRLVRPINKAGEAIDVSTYLVAVPEPDRAQAIAALKKHAQDSSPWERAGLVAAISDSWRQMNARVTLINDPSFWAAIGQADTLTVSRTREVLQIRIVDWDEKQTAMAHILEWLPLEEPDQDLQPRLQAAARDLLRDPALLDRFHASLRAGGLVGEEKAADVVLLAFVSRRDRPINLVIKAQSSSGKNFLVESALAHCPPEDVALVSDLSPAAINYLAPDAWKHRVVVLAEQEAGNRSTYQIRTMMSEEAVVTLTARMTKGGDIVTQERTVEGPTCFISTTTRASIHSENETRVLEVNLDESKVQTIRIIDRTLAGTVGENWKRSDGRELELAVWRTALRMVGLGEVAIPEALHDSLRAAVNLDRVRARRDITKLVSLTKASARLFTEQRERDGNGRILATEQDAHRAKELAGALKSGLPTQLARIAALLWERFAGNVFTNVQAANALGYGDADSARKKLRELESAEVVWRADVEGPDGRRGRPATRWRLNADHFRPDSGHPDDQHGA